MTNSATPDLSVKITDKLTLKNPIITSSGTFGYGAEFADFIDINALGGITTKAITPEPREGNPPPRIIETPSGLLNAIGLENVGLDAFIKTKLPFLETLKTAVIVNVAGKTEEDYVKVVSELSGRKGVDAFEINISCPNVKKGGLSFGTCPDSASSLIKKLRAATNLPLITKLSPNVTDIAEIALSVCDAGTDALSLVNTFRGMAINVNTGRPVLGNIIGGLSGPAIKPLALYNVYTVSLKTAAPIIGMGGVSSAEDALEFIFAGAHAVSIGTAGFITPDATISIIDGVRKYCMDKGVQRVADLTGRAH